MKPTPATCASCGASIYWALTPQGKRMPIDAEPVDTATIWLRVVRDRMRTPVLVVETTTAPLGEQPERRRWRSHFATCEHAAKHRRKG